MVFSTLRRAVPTALIALLFLSFFAQPAIAQNTSGKIIGQVLDPTGAVVPDVTVSAISVDTGTKTVAKTDKTGNFQLLSLPIGRYTVQAEKEGFATTKTPVYTLEINQTQRVDFNLPLAGTSQAVDVTIHVRRDRHRQRHRRRLRHRAAARRSAAQRPQHPRPRPPPARRHRRRNNPATAAPAPSPSPAAAPTPSPTCSTAATTPPAQQRRRLQPQSRHRRRVPHPRKQLHRGVRPQRRRRHQRRHQERHQHLPRQRLRVRPQRRLQRQRFFNKRNGVPARRPEAQPVRRHHRRRDLHPKAPATQRSTSSSSPTRDSARPTPSIHGVAADLHHRRSINGDFSHAGADADPEAAVDQLPSGESLLPARPGEGRGRHHRSRQVRSCRQEVHRRRDLSLTPQAASSTP